MVPSRFLGMVSLLLSSGIALAQQVPQEMTLRDLDGKNVRKLNKDEVTKLMTGAKVSRISARGSQNTWSNDADGTFVASSDNSGANAVAGARMRTTTAHGKWHISDDGRYCVLIEWKGIPNEEWCRYVLETSDGIYTVRSDNVGTERVYKLDVKK